MEKYTTKLDVRDVEARYFGELTEKLSEFGSVRVAAWDELDAGFTIPLYLDVAYEIGKGGAAEDLWDFRELLEAVNVELEEWTANKLAKPVLVQETRDKS